MDNALAEMSSLLNTIAPFDQLPPDINEQIIKIINIIYLVKDEQLPPSNVEEASVFIVRSGALNYFGEQNELLGKYGEGDVCTVFCRPQTQEKVTVFTEEDSLLYQLPFNQIATLIEGFPLVVSFFAHSAEERLKHQVSKLNEEAVIASSLVNMNLDTVYHSPVATIADNETIQQAAIKMTELGFSCLVVTNNEQPVGIITDKDIRRRCVAEGKSFTLAVTDIMTTNMQTLESHHRAYDALMMMTSKHIHHLPITKNDTLVGMVTITDLMNLEGHNAINITSLIHKAQTIDELVQISQLLSKLQVRMAKLGTSAEHVGKSMSAITMAFTRKLIEMALHKIGEAPVPFAWLAAGSQARQEQLAHSDQDNALIIDNSATDNDMAWFAQLATFVCDGLAACGFIYCPGDIMATNTKWCQRQKVWQRYFDQWIETPDPKALLNCSVFFDLTTIYGENSLLDTVRKSMLKKTQSNTLFIAHLSKNALSLRPPLGFFRDFVLIQNGKNKATLDLKHNGIAPIVDLARIYALAQGIKATNTIERLQQAAGSPSLSSTSARNIIDAYQFLTTLRLQHQAQLLSTNQTPDNYLSPKALSRLEREHLKDAFKVIKTLQDSRQSTY